KELKSTIDQLTDLMNYHINNKSNPHNVTSEQVTIISDPSPFQDASYSGDNYPMGISTFHLSSGSTGYPSSYGECLNVKTTKYDLLSFSFMLVIVMIQEFIFGIGIHLRDGQNSLLSPLLLI
ncbi:hypothetical protein ABWK31_17715, partial [Bacillus sp. JJ353]